MYYNEVSCLSGIFPMNGSPADGQDIIRARLPDYTNFAAAVRFHPAVQIQRKETPMRKNNETNQKTDASAASSPNFFSGKGKWIAGAVVAVLLIIYGFGVYHYSSHFPRNVYVNGIQIGGMTLDEAEKTFTDDLDSHKIALKEKERTEIISPQDVDTVIKVGSQISDLQASYNPWSWFTHFFGKDEQSIKLDITYDTAKLTALVDGLECFDKANVVAPEDAYIKAGETAFEIVPEVLGNTVKKKLLLSAVETALSTCKTTIDFEKDDLYKLPSYYEKDQVVQDALQKANKLTSGSITYDFSYTTEKVDYSVSKDWIKISKDFKVSVSDAKVGDYVEELGKKYNTMGGSRDFTTSYGSKINAYGGDYGWKIYFDKEKKKLIKNLKSGKDITREPVYSYKAMCRNSARDDIGDSYVEISISGQEVWLYVNGKCKMNSSCVTGRPPSASTYTGVYSITFKKSPDTLNGPNAGGGSYSSKVTFWMPFNGNQGLHDASWRSSFGGSIYRSNGSHGCVNLPYYAAATLYKYVDAGFPVVIY